MFCNNTSTLVCFRARNEREAANRRKWKQEEEERKRIAELERKQREEEEERLTREKAMSPELQEISLSTGNEEFDKEFGIKGMDTFLIKTSPMPSSFMKDLEDELNHSLVDEERDDEDAGVEEEVTAEEKKADDTLDIPVVSSPVFLLVKRDIFHNATVLVLYQCLSLLEEQEETFKHT